MDWMPVISKVLEAVLIAILPPLAVALVSLILGYAKELWARARLLSPAVTEYIELAAEFAVQAAEQAGAANLIADKKAYALEIAERWLEAHKLFVDLNLVDAAIEKAVSELFPNQGAG